MTRLHRSARACLLTGLALLASACGGNDPSNEAGGGTQAGDGDGDGEPGLPQSCSAMLGDSCCGGTADHSCMGTIEQRIEDLHGLAHWPVRCELPSPCPTLIVTYTFGDPDSPSYAQSTFECIASSIRDHVPGRYIIESRADDENTADDHVFELLPSGEILHASYRPSAVIDDCSWSWAAAYVAPPEPFDACIALSVDGAEQISCLIDDFTDPTLGCAALDSSSC